MKKIENNDVANSLFNSKLQNYSNFKLQTVHTNVVKFYREKNFSSLFDEIDDNKNENYYDNNSFIKEYNLFCDKENIINETKLD